MDTTKYTATPEAPRITKQSKNKIRVDFERTPLWTRLKLKLGSSYFWTNIVWFLFRFVLMVGICYIILFPFISKVAGSFMAPSDFVDPSVRIIPKSFTVELYRAIIVENGYFSAFLNTLLLSVSTALLQTLVSCLIGYGLAKFKFKGNKILFFLVILTMVIPHKTIQQAMGLHFRFFDLGGLIIGRAEQLPDIPGLLSLVTGGSLSINLLDSFWPMLILSITGLAFKNGLYIFMMRQFFHGVPDELEESAYVDGSGVFRTFFQIILPLSIPMMVTIFLFAFSWQWTDAFYTNLFFTSGTIKLMPDLIKTIPESVIANADLYYAGKTLYLNAYSNTAGLMIIIPLVIVYLFCQKSLVQGIERSGLVG